MSHLRDNGDSTDCCNARTALVTSLTFGMLCSESMRISRASMSRSLFVLVVLLDQLLHLLVSAQHCNSSVATGTQHSCAITWGREVECWGQNRLGQLRIPDAVNKVYYHKVQAVTSGDSHTCVLKTDQSVFCWGCKLDFDLAASGLPLYLSEFVARQR